MATNKKTKTSLKVEGSIQTSKQTKRDPMQSIYEKGCDDIKDESDATDICAYCANSDKLQPALYVCLNCSQYGRFMCGDCNKHHKKFGLKHDVKDLSAPVEDKGKNQDIIELEKKLVEKEDEIEQLEKRVKETRKSCMMWEENTHLREEIHLLRKESSKMVEENEILQQESSKMVEENEILQLKSCKMWEENTHLREEIHMLKKESSKMVEENEILQQKSCKMREENTHLRDGILMLKKESCKMMDDKMVQKDFHKMMEINQHLREEIQTLHKKYEQLQKEISNAASNNVVSENRNAKGVKESDSEMNSKIPKKK